jgi:hypothetical protein
MAVLVLVAVVAFVAGQDVVNDFNPVVRDPCLMDQSPPGTGGATVARNSDSFLTTFPGADICLTA